MAEETTKTAAELAAEHVIPDSALVGKGVSAQPNPMEKPEDEAKAVFDEIAKTIIIPAFNVFVEFVAAQFGLIDWTTDADKPISTAVQTALTNMDNAKHDKELRTGSTEENPVYRVLTDNNLTDELKRQLESAYKKEHEHSNKKLLDGLTEEDIKNWNGANVLTKDNTTAYEPTQPYHPVTVKYVADTVKKVGAADMTKAVYDPQNKNTDIFQYADDAVKAAKDALDEDIENIQSSLPMDFENQMAWKGCAYSYTKADNTYTEQWKKGEELQAEKISVKAADGSWTETYKRYAEGTLTETVTVVSVKDASGNWTVTVTEEVAEA